MSGPMSSCAIAVALSCAAALAACTSTSAHADDVVADAATRQRPAAWHARERILAGPPVARTSDEIRRMRSRTRPHLASDPALACYATRYIVNRCPQAGRPWLF